MSSSARRVVLTGLGVINPIGVSASAFWAGLQQGKSAIRTIQAFNPAALPTQIAAEIPDFDAKGFIDKKDRKSLRVMARAIQMAVAASQLALDDSRVNKEQLDPTRFGVEFGAGLLPTELEELGAASQASTTGKTVDLKKWGAQGLPCIPPLWMLKYLPNMLASHVSILHNAQGPNNTITESDVAGILALGEANRILRRGQADFFLVGGADAKINPLSMVRQCLFTNLSRRNEAPEKACRPFDRQRDGSVIGEGAAVLVLEELEHATRRDARIYAELTGFAAGFDRDHSGRAMVRAIRTALAQAGITPDDVDHVNAHGLGSIKADPWEARAIHTVFGGCRRRVPTFAAKSYFANLGAGSGVSELAASILALHHGTVPPTLNYETPDPECPVTVNARPEAVVKPHVLKVSFTELGQCAAAVFRKW